VRQSVPEKVKLKEHKDWFVGRRMDVLELISQRRVARIKYLQNGFLKVVCNYKL